MNNIIHFSLDWSTFLNQGLYKIRPFQLLQLRFLWLVIFVANTVYADPLVVDEALLLLCKKDGMALYDSCVQVTPITPEQLSSCSTLKLTYLLCLQQLNAPYPLVPSLDPDPYVYSPFTPCTYETGHMVLDNICVTLPV